MSKMNDFRSSDLLLWIESEVNPHEFTAEELVDELFFDKTTRNPLEYIRRLLKVLVEKGHIECISSRPTKTYAICNRDY